MFEVCLLNFMEMEMTHMNKKEKIKREIENKYPEFPIELLDIISKYVSYDITEDCKTMGINDSCAEN